MTEFIYDTEECKVVIGRAAYDLAVQDGQLDPRDCEDLTVLLAADSKEECKPQSYIDKERRLDDDYLTPARWVLNIANQSSSGAPRPVTRNQLTILYNRDLAPDPRQTESRGIGTMTDLNAKLGPTAGRQLGKYSEWTIRDVGLVARRIKSRTGVWPTGEDFQHEFEHGRGPSLTWIERNFGVSAVQEYIGKWNQRDKTESDMLDWAVSVMLANPKKPLGTAMVNCLSARGVGPSLMPIRGMFRSLGNFQYHAEVEHARHLQERASREAVAILDAKAVLARSSCTNIDDYIANIDANIAARILLIEELLGLDEITDERLQRLPLLRLGAFIESLSRFKSLSVARFETASITIGVDDILWTRCLDHLVVAQEELEMYQGRKGRGRKS